MADEGETTFLQRTGDKLKNKKLLVGGGTGLSAAAVIFLYATFATKGDLEKARLAQATQWQQISQLRTELNEVKAQNMAYEMLLRYVSTGAISYGNVRTNH